MKYMRLGSKPDCFATLGNITSAISELESDIVLAVGLRKFHLHLFPLLNKCGALNKILIEAVDAGEDEVKLEDFPGGADCFELCAKFCYGVIITLNAHNVSAVRCGAEYLKMSEIVDKGNLIYKLDVFLNTSILRGWRDSIICLQSSKQYLPWSEDLKIIDRCIDSITSKVAVDPSDVDWSFSYTKAAMALDHVSVSQSTSPAVWNGVQGCPWLAPVPRDWWVQDLSDLDIDLFWRVIVAVEASNDLVGEALRVYAQRWLPELSVDHTKLTLECGDAAASRHRQMLEMIVALLPPERGSSSCSFLLQLLKAAIALNASVSSRGGLARRIGLQLEEASLCDLVFPVDVVMRIVEYYLLQSQPVSPEKEVDFGGGSGDGSKIKVAKLIDGYLAEIAKNPELPLGKFVQLAEAVPDFARPSHDGLYRAVDMYLKEHPGLTKGERKQLCSLMDIRRLSVEACMHAAQNDRLPLRTVVQVLFFEQVRTASTGGFLLNEMPSNIRALLGPESGDELSISDAHAHAHAEFGARSNTVTGELGWDSMDQDFSSLKGDLASLKTRVADVERERQSFADTSSLRPMERERQSFTVTSSSRPMERERQSFADTSSLRPMERERQSFAVTSSLRPPKPMAIFSKPKKFLQKLFSRKVSNSASSRESEVTMFADGKMPTGRRRRHSIT